MYARKQADKQTYMQTDKQTYMQTDRQTYLGLLISQHVPVILEEVLPPLPELQEQHSYSRKISKIIVMHTHYECQNETRMCQTQTICNAFIQTLYLVRTKHMGYCSHLNWRPFVKYTVLAKKQNLKKCIVFLILHIKWLIIILWALHTIVCQYTI